MMAALRALFLAGFGIAVLAASLVLSSGTPGASQATPTDPLRGGKVVPVAVVNTADVNVVGLPAVQIDNPNIKSGLGVVEVREAARKPFAFWEEMKMGEGGMPGAQGMNPYQLLGPRHQVGPDQWVVLTYGNSVGCAQPREKLSLRMWVTYDYSAQGLGKGARALQLILTEQGVFLEPEGLYMHTAGSQPMNLYIQPGQEFWFELWRSGEGAMNELRGHAELSVWVSGYLVPAVQFQGVGPSPLLR